MSRRMRFGLSRVGKGARLRAVPTRLQAATPTRGHGTPAVQAERPVLVTAPLPTLQIADEVIE